MPGSTRRNRHRQSVQPASHRRARKRRAARGARKKLAAFLGCHPADIVWTSGATEANNTSCTISGGRSTRRPSLGFRHRTSVRPRIRQNIISANARNSFPSRMTALIDLDWLTAELADSRPGLVGVMAANNETGVIQPWREILAICRQYQVPFFSDAVQWLGKMPAKELGECDFLSGAAHKFGGPRGIGFLKTPGKSHVTPLLVGGKQEQGRRAGTENVAAILSMLAALEVREKQIARGEHVLRGVWRENFERQLLHKLPGAMIVGAKSPRLWNTVRH